MNWLTKQIAGLSLVSFAAFAGTYDGTLIDVMCKAKDPATHTKTCAIHCAKSGFGLVTAEGKFLKFDKEGDAKALTALKATKREKDLKATVTGDLQDDQLTVQSIEIK